MRSFLIQGLLINVSVILGCREPGVVSGDGFGLLGFEWLSKGVQTVLRLGELEWHSSANQMSWSGRLGPKWLLNLGCVILFCGSVFLLVVV